MSKIGVFDSGIGGRSVAITLQQALPDSEIIFLDDHQNMPYGDKNPGKVLSLVLPKLKQLQAKGCALIVIACNTVTTHHISTLRDLIDIPLIGIEPMVKPAAELTRTGVIAVCATPSTLASQRYKWLKQTYAHGIKVLEPDCSDWAYLIENNTINESKIQQQITQLCDNDADIIVLGCTHYHWIEETIQHYTNGRAKIIQPEQAIVKRVKLVLSRLQQTSHRAPDS